MYGVMIIQVKERVSLVACIELLSQRELLHHVIETSTSLKDKDILRVLSEPLDMTQEEGPHSLKLTSETLTDTNTEPSIFWLLKAHTQVNICSVAEKPLSPLEMCSQLTEFPREQPFVTLNLQLVIKVHTQDALELMPPSLGILKMEPEPESDFHQDQEKQSQELAEPLLELSLEEEETRSLL